MTPAAAIERAHRLHLGTSDFRAPCTSTTHDEVCRTLTANELAYAADIERVTMGLEATREVVDQIFGAVVRHILGSTPVVVRSGAIIFENGGILLDDDSFYTALLRLRAPNGPECPPHRIYSRVLTDLCSSEPSRRRYDNARRVFFYRALKLDRFFAWASARRLNVIALRAGIESPAAAKAEPKAPA
jgi:hypothetical protein